MKAQLQNDKSHRRMRYPHLCLRQYSNQMKMSESMQTNGRMKRVLLATLGIVLVVLVVLDTESPMLLIFPLWIFTYLFQKQFENLIGKIPKSYGFIIAGVVYGLVIEVFAIVDNLDRPESQRVLLDADPFKDLIFGIFYYFFVIVSWYLLLRKIRFTKTEIFLITGIYGIFVEETGQVILRIFEQPLMGGLYAIIVMFVYGLFPMLALTITEGRFSDERKGSSIGAYALAIGVLFFQFAVYGNTVYPMLKAFLT